MKYKLFVTDLDDTLLDDHSRLSHRNQEAMQRIRDKGVKTVLCSGRAPSSLAPFERRLGNTEPGCYGIGFNGCSVYAADSRRILHELTLEEELFHFILEKLAPFSLDVFVYSNYVLYVKEMNPNTKAYISRCRVPYQQVEHFDALPQTPHKLFIRGDRADLTQVYEEMREEMEERCNMFFSSSCLLEFTHKEGTKGNGLLYLAGYLGISPEEILAMGDNFNDISLLKAAGLGISVANGEPEVQAAADEVSQGNNNQDAVAEIIDRYF